MESRQGCGGRLAAGLDPAQAARDHQVQHHKEPALHNQHDPFADAPDGEDALANDVGQRRHRGAKDEWTVEANLLEGPADDAPFETLDVDDDIGQLGH